MNSPPSHPLSGQQPYSSPPLAIAAGTGTAASPSQPTSMSTNSATALLPASSALPSSRDGAVTSVTAPVTSTSFSSPARDSKLPGYLGRVHAAYDALSRSSLESTGNSTVNFSDANEPASTSTSPSSSSSSSVDARFVREVASVSARIALDAALASGRSPGSAVNGSSSSSSVESPSSSSSATEDPSARVFPALLALAHTVGHPLQASVLQVLVADEESRGTIKPFHADLLGALISENLQRHAQAMKRLGSSVSPAATSTSKSASSYVSSIPATPSSLEEALALARPLIEGALVRSSLLHDVRNVRLQHEHVARERFGLGRVGQPAGGDGDVDDVGDVGDGKDGGAVRKGRKSRDRKGDDEGKEEDDEDKDDDAERLPSLLGRVKSSKSMKGRHHHSNVKSPRTVATTRMSFGFDKQHSGQLSDNHSSNTHPRRRRRRRTGAGAGGKGRVGFPSSLSALADAVMTRPPLKSRSSSTSSLAPSTSTSTSSSSMAQLSLPGLISRRQSSADPLATFQFSMGLSVPTVTAPASSATTSSSLSSSSSSSTADAVAVCTALRSLQLNYLLQIGESLPSAVTDVLFADDVVKLPLQSSSSSSSSSSSATSSSASTSTLSTCAAPPASSSSSWFSEEAAAAWIRVQSQREVAASLAAVAASVKSAADARVRARLQIRPPSQSIVTGVQQQGEAAKGASSTSLAETADLMVLASATGAAPGRLPDVSLSTGAAALDQAQAQARAATATAAGAGDAADVRDRMPSAAAVSQALASTLSNPLFGLPPVRAFTHLRQMERSRAENIGLTNTNNALSSMSTSSSSTKYSSSRGGSMPSGGTHTYLQSFTSRVFAVSPDVVEERSEREEDEDEDEDGEGRGEHEEVDDVGTGYRDHYDTRATGGDGDDDDDHDDGRSTASSISSFGLGPSSSSSSSSSSNTLPRFSVPRPSSSSSSSSSRTHTGGSPFQHVRLQQHGLAPTGASSSKSTSSTSKSSGNIGAGVGAGGLMARQNPFMPSVFDNEDYQSGARSLSSRRGLSSTKAGTGTIGSATSRRGGGGVQGGVGREADDTEEVGVTPVSSADDGDDGSSDSTARRPHPQGSSSSSASSSSSSTSSLSSMAAGGESPAGIGLGMSGLGVSSLMMMGSSPATGPRRLYMSPFDSAPLGGGVGADGRGGASMTAQQQQQQHQLKQYSQHDPFSTPAPAPLPPVSTSVVSSSSSLSSGEPGSISGGHMTRFKRAATAAMPPSPRKHQYLQQQHQTYHSDASSGNNLTVTITNAQGVSSSIARQQQQLQELQPLQQGQQQQGARLGFPFSDSNTPSSSASPATGTRSTRAMSSSGPSRPSPE